jgi:hypothetical protein
MSKIKEHIEKTIHDYDNSWKNVRDKREHLENLTSVIFTEVFNICWKYTDNDTLELIMNDIDKIKEENNLPI